jgi:uncharacterized protein YbjT (DUF2867 family)
MSLNILLLGATGMVGEGVLHECLKHPQVASVLVVNRRPCDVAHPKLTEIVHADFLNLRPLEGRLVGLDACFFCMGVSSVGMKPDDYKRITYDLTLHVAETLARLNPGMTFCYVSGAGTDSSEQGRSRWARVKGKTENDLLKLPFKAAFMFRPGYIQPTPGLKRTYKVYRLMAPFYPVIRRLAGRYTTTMEELGLAMIQAAISGYDKPVLECPDIVQLSRRQPH